MKSHRFLLPVILTVLCGFARAEPAKELDASTLPPRWDPKIVETWEAIPIYDPSAARMKPLATFAKYEMVRNRSMDGMELKFSDKTKRKRGVIERLLDFFSRPNKLSATEWLLDCLFRPEVANTYPNFLVEEGEALEEVGMPVEARRDRYSYLQLFPYREAIRNRGQEVDRKREEHKARTGETLQVDRRDEEISDLAGNLAAYEMLIGAFEPFRNGIPISATPGLEYPAGVTGGDRLSITKAIDLLNSNKPWGELLKGMNDQNTQAVAQGMPKDFRTPIDFMQPVVSLLSRNDALREKLPKNFLDRKAVSAVIDEHLADLHAKSAIVQDAAIVHATIPHLFWAAYSSSRLQLFPGPDANSAWLSFGDLAGQSLVNPSAFATQRPALEQLEAIRSATDDASLQATVKALGESLKARAQNIPHYGDIGVELLYLKLDPFNWAKWLFLLVFVLTAFSWINPQSTSAQIIYKFAKFGIWVPVVFLLTAMTLRYLIIKWGPVTTIYETMPFIALVAVVLAILLEFIYKNRIPLALAAAIGCGLLWMAEMWETTKDQSDTMKNMEAVLRSRFWLWTHVTTINMGYATVFLAALLSSVYIFLRLFDLPRRDKELFKMLTQSAYGILCFGLLVSLVGTILGGIWGNESWGRFWGWDPKENGALIIVLWCIATLHMRLAGWIREIGIHVCNTIGATFVIFSWFHVNQLSVGLHTYGHTSGIMFWILTSYIVFGSIALIGIVCALLAGKSTKTKTAAPGTLHNAAKSIAS